MFLIFLPGQEFRPLKKSHKDANDMAHDLRMPLSFTSSKATCGPSSNAQDAISDTGGSSTYGGPIDANGRLLMRERLMLTLSMKGIEALKWLKSPEQLILCKVYNMPFLMNHLSIIVIRESKLLLSILLSLFVFFAFLVNCSEEHLASPNPPKPGKSD